MIPDRNTDGRCSSRGSVCGCPDVGWYIAGASDGACVDHYDYEDSAGRPYTGLYQQQDGQWIYVKNGAWAYDYTGFVAKDGDWWYVENGRITFHCNGLVRGLVNGNDTWWYVTGSKVNFCNTVASNACGWWKITNGRVDLIFRSGRKRLWLVEDHQWSGGFWLCRL